jgi:uncharacterized protein with GYD domain
MTKLEASAMKDPRGRRKAGHEWKAKVEKLVPGIKWLAHYALLGPYDFMTIYQAADDAAAARVSLLSRELGAASAESWPAMTYDEFLPIAEQVEKA